MERVYRIGTLAGWIILTMVGATAIALLLAGCITLPPIAWPTAPPTVAPSSPPSVPPVEPSTPPTPGPVVTPTPTPTVTPTPEPTGEKLPAWPANATAQPWSDPIPGVSLSGALGDLVNATTHELASKDEGRDPATFEGCHFGDGSCWVKPEWACRLAAALRVKGVRAMVPPYDGCGADLVVIQAEDQYPCGPESHFDATQETGPRLIDGADRSLFARWAPNPDAQAFTFAGCAEQYAATPPAIGCGAPPPPPLFEIACNPGWALDCVPRVRSREYCDSQGFTDRNECPPRNECPEGVPCDRIACEHYILGGVPPHAKVLSGDITLTPHFPDNAWNMWDVNGQGRFRICNFDNSICSEEMSR